LQNASDKLVRQQNMSKDMQVRAAEKIEALKAQYVGSASASWTSLILFRRACR
jgi:hypothetical protein